MLPKFRRVNLKKDFRWVSSGQTVFTKFTKLFIKFGENDSPKFGVATSSRFFKKAYERNQAKRITFEALKLLEGNLPEDINIVALPKRGVLEVKSKDLTEDLKSELIKKGFLKCNN